MHKTYLQRFSNPEFFLSISECRLRQLIRDRRYSIYLVSRGLVIKKPLDIEKLSWILGHPTAAIPNELIDDLYHIQEMSAPAHFDTLKEAALHAGMELELGDEIAPADVVVQIFLKDPQFLLRQHVQSHTARRRLFEVFWGPPGFDVPQHLPTKFVELENSLREWLENHGNGQLLKLYFDQPDERMRLIVVHGGLVKRTGAVKDGKASSHIYRPLVFDVVWYDPRSGELLINMGTDRPREKQMYLAEFGRFFYHSQFHFKPALSKYTLEPIRRDGAMSLVCTDVPELERATLTELVLDRGGPRSSGLVLKSRDLFRDNARRGDSFPPDPMVSAKIEFVLRGRSGTRTVQIRTGNQLAVGRRDDIDWINRFLVQRKFCNERALNDEVLASA